MLGRAISHLRLEAGRAVRASRRIGALALDLLLPPVCSGCRAYGALLCSRCTSSMARLSTPQCQICCAPVARGPHCAQCAALPLAVDRIGAPYVMEGALRRAIHHLKYESIRALGGPLGQLLGRWLEEAEPHLQGHSLVPVPLHKGRLRQRGYNQSALLAREAGRVTGLPVDEDLLMRTRATPPQVSLSTREQREQNVAGSFQARRHVAGQRFVLVDDVVTTGSTMSACASALKAAGAASVKGIAVARQVGLAARS